MRFGLRTTILALLLATTHPVGGGVVEASPRARTIPLTMAASERVHSAGRIELSVPATHVAFSWRGSPNTGVEFRTVGLEGEVGPWRRASEAHDMEAGHRHWSAVQSVDRPSAIDWRPIRPRGSWMGPVTFDHMNTIDGTRVPIEPSRTGGAPGVAGGAPQIVTRTEWGADESIKRTSGSCRRNFYPVQQLFVHHTAGSNFDSNPRATMRAMYWYHTVRRGWCDLGYNFVISRDGTIFEGRWARGYKPWETHSSEDRSGRVVAGAHVSSFNSGSIGISLMGNFETAPVPPDMHRSLAELLAWEVDRHDLSPFGSHTYRNPETGLERKLPFIAGHRDAGQTACPGRNLYLSMKQVRRDTKAVIGAGKDNSSLTLTAESPVVVDYGGSTVLSGALFDENEGALGGRTITLYERVEDQGWKAHSTAVTGADGRFAFPLAPTVNSKLLAVYEGDVATWGSQSDPVAIKVRHALTLAPAGITPDSTGVYHFSASTSSLTFVGTLNPIHVGRNVTISIDLLNADGTSVRIASGTAAAAADGTFTFTFARPDVGTTGTYSAVAKLGRDDRHAFGASAPVVLVAE